MGKIIEGRTEYDRSLGCSISYDLPNPSLSSVHLLPPISLPLLPPPISSSSPHPLCPPLLPELPPVSSSRSGQISPTYSIDLASCACLHGVARPCLAAVLYGTLARSTDPLVSHSPDEKQPRPSSAGQSYPSVHDQFS